jgi:hypothetical protein
VALSNRDGRDGEDEIASPVGSGSDSRIRVMGCPARDVEDQLALEMLRRLLNDQEWEFEIKSAGGTSTGEWVDQVAECNPAVVCVASLPPGGLAHTRYVCKKLRSRLPDLRIFVARWGLESDFESDREHLEAVGANQTATTLRETRDQLNAWLPVFAEQRARGLANERVLEIARGGRPSLARVSGGNDV